MYDLIAIYKDDIFHYIGLVLFMIALPCWGIIAVAFHEFGHAIASCVTGFKPTSIVIGTGKEDLFSFKIFSMKFIVKKQGPYSGLTYYNLEFDKNLWWKNSIISLGGISVDILLLIPLLFLVSTAEHIDNKINSIVVLAPIISQLILIIGNIFPRNVSINGKTYFSDTKIFLFSFALAFFSKKFDKMRESYKYSVEQYTQAPIDKSKLDLLSKYNGSNFFLYFQADNDLKKGHYKSAIKKLNLILSINGLSKAERTFVLGRMAFIPIISGDKKYLNKAIEWCNDALSLAPESKILQVTYGILIIEHGEFQNGIIILSKMKDSSSSMIEKSLIFFYLSIAYMNMGNTQLAKSYFQEGKELGNPFDIYSRVGNLEKNLTS